MQARHWSRRGDWLELTPGRSVLKDEEQLEQWLRHTLRVPLHMIRAWKHEKSLIIAGDRLRLPVFHREEVDAAPADQPAVILYEDDSCLVAYKEAGRPVHPANEVQEEARTALSHAVACHYAWTGQEVRIRHIHRLDADTTGPVLYAKTALSHAILDEAMREKQIHRTYQAVVQGEVKPKSGTINAPIGKDRHKRNRRIVTPNGDHAVTHYETLKTSNELSLVQLELETGRTHQIRVHMANLGYPLAGDTLYGGSRTLFHRQALHGVALSFPHPFSGEEVVVFAPMPDDMNLLIQKI
ncbi:RluA family pseudouridine synthase [Paenibacillus sp. 1001270B_150601_E10]|uniref:RluA family pseudouridine synthase n=1 Tax=Paenibacillus sp. 1001270B_150601_E10 TaxID=2787079 RepID=UPI00189E6402|nr:RluA family pseudouridine synthase [Paenibacillus sp. 1001270B_150601_E10]